MSWLKDGIKAAAVAAIATIASEVARTVANRAINPPPPAVPTPAPARKRTTKTKRKTR